MAVAYKRRPPEHPFSYEVLRKLFERGRMTRRQWADETCLLKREVVQETERYVRRTKHHVMIDKTACLQYLFGLDAGEASKPRGQDTPK